MGQPLGAVRPMRPTQQDVADRAEVSRALVSLVMRGSESVSPESRARVLAAASALGYRPNAHARSLAKKEVRTVGVLINDMANPYFGGVYAALEVAAEQAGLDLLVAPGNRSGGREVTLVNTLLEHSVAGLALLSPVMSRDDLARLVAATPTVLVGREERLPGVDVVTIDERYAVRQVVDHLVGLGHRRIAHIDGGEENRPSHDRTLAFVEAMTERGLEPVVVPGAFTPEGGAAGAEVLLRRTEPPTAIFAANDLAAVGAMGVFRGRGFDVPRDISVVGYDDSQIARLDLVRLTSVQQPIADFGARAVTMLGERVAGLRTRSRVERLVANLVVRDTTGPMRAAGR